MTHVGVIQDGAEDPVEADKASKGMDLCPPRHNEGICGPGNLCPVKSEDAHTQAIVDTKELVDDDIIGGDPADPVEVGESGEEIAGKEEEEKGGHAEIDIVSVATEASAFAVLFCVEGIEEGAGDQILGPEHTGWPHQEASAEACQTKACHLSCQDEGCGKAVAQFCAIVELCDDDGKESVGESDGDVCHHVDEGVLLDVPWAGVEGNFVGTKTEGAGGAVSANGEGECEEFAYGMGEEEENGGNDCGCRLAEVEKDVCGAMGRNEKEGQVGGGEGGNVPCGEGEQEADDPHSEG